MDSIYVSVTHPTVNLEIMQQPKMMEEPVEMCLHVLGLSGHGPVGQGSIAVTWDKGEVHLTLPTWMHIITSGTLQLPERKDDSLCHLSLPYVTS